MSSRLCETMWKVLVFLHDLFVALNVEKLDGGREMHA